MGTVGLLTCVALLQIAVSVQFALRLGRGADGVFLFLFGVASIAVVDRFLWTPLTSLLLTPAAFAVGLIAYYFDRRRTASMAAQREQR